MPLTFNNEDKMNELKKLLIPNETYIATTWASINIPTPKLFQYCIETKKPNIGTNNVYCYVGVTSEHLNIVTLHWLDVTRVTGYFSIPLKDIKSITSKYGMVASSLNVNFENEKFKINWSNLNTGIDIKNQRQAVKKICQFINEIDAN